MESTLYWIFRLDGIRGIGIGLFVISLGLLVIGFIRCFVDNSFDFNDKETKYGITKYFRNNIFMLIIGLSIMTFVPSTKEMFIIKGIDATYNYIKNDEQLKSIHNKTLKSLDKLLSNYLDKD